LSVQRISGKLEVATSARESIPSIHSLALAATCVRVLKVTSG
jgi:hypothetical protein